MTSPEKLNSTIEPAEFYYSPGLDRAMVDDCVNELLAKCTPAGRVYLALAFRVNRRTGIVDSTYEQIAEKARMSRRQAATGVAKLIELGYLELVKQGRQHVPNVYRLHVKPVDNSSSAETCTPASSAETCTPETVQECRNVPPAVQKPAPTTGSYLGRDTGKRSAGRQAERQPQAPQRPQTQDDRPEVYAVRKALHERTGKLVDQAHARLVIKQLLKDRVVKNREAYLVGAIQKDDNPARFLPTPQPPRFDRSML